jgi:hypothetical protein
LPPIPLIGRGFNIIRSGISGRLVNNYFRLIRVTKHPISIYTLYIVLLIENLNIAVIKCQFLNPNPVPISDFKSTIDLMTGIAVRAELISRVTTDDFLVVSLVLDSTIA